MFDTSLQATLYCGLLHSLPQAVAPESVRLGGNKTGGMKASLRFNDR